MNSNKHYIIIGFFVTVAFIYLVRLFYIQVATDRYKIAAETRLSDVEKIPAYRGLIYDRKGELLVFNKAIYQLEAKKREIDTTKKAEICKLLEIKEEKFDSLYRSKKEQLSLPFVFLEEVSQEHYARIQDRFDFKGFEFVTRIIRSYPHKNLANTLGYIAEISQAQLDKDTTHYYRKSDLIGFSGLEKTYEPYLRGKRGVKYIKMSAKRVPMGSFMDGAYDTLPERGKNLYTTIDLELQQYGEKLMENKIGGVVAIDPKTGGILSMITSPTYDPNLFTGEQFSKNYGPLVRDKSKPLYNRAVQAQYPPGSIFKILQSLVALGDGSTTVDEQINVSDIRIGDHAPAGFYDYKRAIQLSSNRYFVKLYYRMLDKQLDANMYKNTHKSFALWYESIISFGLGSRLGTDIANEGRGQVPSTDFYDKRYGKYRWFRTYIYSNAIGQGELLVTPLQMANMAAIIANRGYYYTPHFVQSIDKDKSLVEKFYQKHYTKVQNKAYYDGVADAMESVVMSGTARSAIIKNIAVCGKTGTIENPHGEDHSCFIAFAPKDNPKIAIAVYVENAGFGATWAAPIAALMIEKYLKDSITDSWREKRILEKRFINIPEPVIPKDSTTKETKPVATLPTVKQTDKEGNEQTKSDE
jgi:penicillin-binding protein 2